MSIKSIDDALRYHTDTSDESDDIIKEDKLSEVKKILNLSDWDEVSYVEITPDQANDLLAYNRQNRPLSKRFIDDYAKQMKSGEWKLDSSAITFNNEGILTNGQHRLSAIVQANVPVRMLVAFGVENHPEMDRGKSRTIRENINIGNNVPERLRNRADIQKVATASLSMGRHGRLTTLEAEEFLKKYEDQLIAAADMGLFKGSRGVSSNAISVELFAAYMAGVSADILIRIRKVLNSGVTDGKQDAPIIALRDEILHTPSYSKGGTKEIYNRVCYCITEVEKKHVRKSTKNIPGKYPIPKV